MRGQPNRLAAATAGPLAGSAIDRDQKLQFKLDGRTIEGFAGDSVLSAVLAAGIDTVGRGAEGPLALSSRFAPAIIAAAQASDPQRALAMERTPITAGAEYRTLAPRSRYAALHRLRNLLAPGTSFGVDVRQANAMALPWTEGIGAVETPADLIVVGGGVAGMSAAVAAADSGLSVILLEASPRLGGYGGLFGSLDGEETPEASWLRLGAAIAGSPGITALTHAAVYAARPGAVRVHITDKADTMPSARVVDLHASYIVIATGASERLPVFAGNRLPGIVGLREAYDLARNYGVWCGQSALFATASSAAYRLAMLARDAGIAVPRIIDARPQPQSRFIEFSKAYGITMAPGTIIAEARHAPQGAGLVVSPHLAMAGFAHEEPTLTADRLVVCGGWQPDLELWHMAGGTSHWNAQQQRLEPGSGPQGMALAGNAAGYLGHSACLASGRAAINQLLDRPAVAVTERRVDPIYETADAPCPIAPPSEQAVAPSFLDAGHGALARPRPAATRWPGWLPRVPSAPAWNLADVPQPLTTPDIAAGVQLGLIAPDSAGAVARERVAMVTIATRSSSSEQGLPPDMAPLVPGFLTGRFGPEVALWLIEPEDRRALEPGALLQRDSDSADPQAAIGVVLRAVENGSIALLAAPFARAGRTAAVREQGRAIPVRLTAPYRGAGN